MSRATGTELRQSILVEARRVLTTQGYTALSTRRIAKAVGCTATSIYLYFDNKDALIHALIDEGMQELRVRLEAARAAAPTAGPVSRRLEPVARAYVDFGREQPEFYEVMFMLHPQHLERYPADSYRSARRNLEIFAEEMEATDPAAAFRRATILWSSLHGLVSLLIAQRIDRSVDVDALVTEAVQDTCLLADRPARTTAP